MEVYLCLTLGVGTPSRIVHIEDEPEVIYAQIIAEELHPNMVVEVDEITPTGSGSGPRIRNMSWRRLWRQISL